VTARQPLVINSASSGAASAVNDTQAQLEIARKREVASKAALDTAASEESLATAALDAANAALAAEKAKPAAEQDAAAIKVLSDKAIAVQADLTLKQNARQAADSTYKSATAATKAIEAIADARVASANASTGGAGSFGDPLARPAMDKAAVDAIAGATVSIVNAVVNKGHLSDSCMNYFVNNRNRIREKTITAEQIESIETLCQEVIKANIESYKMGTGSEPMANLSGVLDKQPKTWRQIAAETDPNTSISKEQAEAIKRLLTPAPATNDKPAKPPGK